MRIDMVNEVLQRDPMTGLVVVVVVVHKLIVVSLEGEGAKATLTHRRQVYKPLPIADSGAAYRSIGDAITGPARRFARQGRAYPRSQVARASVRL
jgi:hypothetical protein